METTGNGNGNGKEVSDISVLARKKNVSKKGETDKISEKMEGGIIVRRVEGRKVEPKEKKKEREEEE